METPISSAPNNNRPTSEGTISNATPVAASLTAARVSTLFDRIYFYSFRTLDLVRNGLKLLALHCCLSTSFYNYGHVFQKHFHHRGFLDFLAHRAYAAP
jgi:hypothetical protein